MIRPIAILVAAMQLSRPGIPTPEAVRYAKALNEVGARYDFDPLTAVAIIHYETYWRPRAVSADGEDYGLGQVRARWVGACRNDEDPVNSPSEGCKAVKEALLDGVYNIHRMATIIAANREFCRQKTGTAWAHQWLAGYQGLNFPGRDVWCKAGPKTYRVLEYRKELIAKLLPRPKIKAVAQKQKTPVPKRRGAEDKAAPRRVEKVHAAKRR